MFYYGLDLKKMSKIVWHDSYSDSVEIAARPQPYPFIECEIIICSVHQEKAYSTEITNCFLVLF